MLGSMNGDGGRAIVYFGGGATWEEVLPQHS